ncbi:MAG TPA: glycerophosphodiester phosphodiesterase family protein [Pseudomonadales bacterium]|nr:glycerophosphodiester phosphodiesterase family protein [Pseudomonadales bacterium]
MITLDPDYLIAHRGYQRLYPENSPLALEKAIACGARFVEIDVQFSADGIPLLYHDDTLERLSGRTGKLTQYHYRALQEMTAGEPARFGDSFADVKISGLAELTSILRRHPHVQAFVELKEEAVRDYGALQCLDVIHETLAPVIARCVLISFDLDALRMARQAGFRRLGPVLRDWNMRHAIASELEAEVIFINYKRIPLHDSLLMETCAVAVYEIDTPELAQQLLERGARYIETFAIGELLARTP